MADEDLDDETDEDSEEDAEAEADGDGEDDDDDDEGGEVSDKTKGGGKKKLLIILGLVLLLIVGGAVAAYFTGLLDPLLNGDESQAEEDALLKDAVFYDSLSFDEAIQQNLKIMDGTALTLARDHSLPIKVFDFSKENALLDIACGKSIGTLISS